MQVTWILIIINTLVFILQQIGLFAGMSFTPVTLVQEPWTLITSMFMHGGFQHLLLNMFGLWMFGSVVEHELGKKKMLMIYFFSGLVGSLAYMLFSISPFISALGASGAIFGLIGGATILKPKMIVWTTFGPIPMIFAAITWGVAEFIGFFGVDTIAQSAHIGGLIGGIIITLLLFTKINEKFIIGLISLPIIISIIVGFSMPLEISSYTEVPQKFILNNSESDINFKLNTYNYQEDYIITITNPSRGKFNLAEYSRILEQTTKKLHTELFQKKCQQPIEYEIYLENETAILKGNLCSKNFNAFAKICEKNIDVRIIEFYDAEPSITVVSCTGLTS